MNKIEITITSYPDSPGLVAELWCEQGMFGEIRQRHDTQSFTLELFPLEAGYRPVFDLQAFESALTGAKERLREIEGTATHVQSR